MEYKSRPVSSEDMDATYSVPTIKVNRFMASTTPQEFRIAFGESATADSPINYRIALALTPFEAFELKHMLENLLVPFEQQIREILAAGEESADAKTKE